MNRKLFLSTAIFIVLVLSDVLEAQTPLATLVGTLRDSSGGVITGATVTVRHLASGAVRQTHTTESGDYTFVSLPVGEYQIDAEQPGFQHSKIVGIVLQVNQTARVDIALKVGEISDTLTVEEQAPLVRSEEASVGTVVDNAKVTTLPLNGRNFRQLAMLSPGVLGADPNGYNGEEMIVGAGLRGELSSTRLDGIENSSIQEKYAGVVTPSVEAIEEFRVETGNYQADHGSLGGVVINASIKAGTNSFRGSIYEFLRNDKLDARSLFDNPNTPQPPLRQNQFGVAVGGPVIKNKTFFFFNYEGFRIRRSSTLRGRVPTDAEKAGNYSGQATIYDPATTAPDPANPGGYVRQPFPGNQIPSARFDPMYNIAQKYWPAPNNPAGGVNFNYLRVASRPDDTDQYHIRIDHRLTSRDSFFARYSRQDREIYTPSLLPDAGGNYNSFEGRNGVVSHTHTFGPNILNEAKFGYTRSVKVGVSQNSDKIGVGEGGVFPIGGFQGVSEVFRMGFPSFQVSGMSAVSESATYPLIDTRFQWLDTFSWVTSKHTLRMGGEFTFLQENAGSGGSFPRGSWDFSGQYTSLPLASTAALLHGLPDFQLGLSSAQRLTTALVPEFWRYFRRRTFAAFLNDSWKVSPSLTLELGLRYSILPGASELHGYLSNFDLATGEVIFPEQLSPLLDSLEPNLPFKYRRNGPNRLHETDSNNLAPRFGFAYRPFGSNNTVVRGGYGLYYGQGTTREPTSGTAESPPAQVYRNLFGDPVAPNLNPLYVGLPSIVGADVRNAFTGATLWGADPNWQDPLIQQWNLSVQRSLPFSTAFELSYVGNKANHLEFLQEDNQPTPLGPGDPRLRMPYLPWNRINLVHSRGNSTYHGFLSKLEKRYSHGLGFIWSYALGKAIGDRSSSWTSGASDGVAAMDSRNVWLEKGRLAYDVRQAMSLGYTYELPFGPGKPYVNYHGVAGKILGGWQMAGIVTLQTGHPFTVYGGAILNIPNRTDPRTNRLRDGNLPSSQRKIERWFDVSAFAPPAPYTFGNAGRNIIDGPGHRNLDFSLLKSTQITETHRLEFRFEVFNFTNTPPLMRPNNNITAPTAGQITSAGPGREIQIALKYAF
jgi:hypothetical protein